MINIFAFLLSFSILYPWAPSQQAKPPGNWELMSPGIKGKVKSLTVVTLRQAGISGVAPNASTWDTADILQQTFDERGNQLARTVRSLHSTRRPAPLETSIDESFTYDEDNRVTATRTWMENSYIKETWTYNRHVGRHTVSIHGKDVKTETISYIADGTLQLAEYREGDQCLTRRIFTDTDFDSTVIYSECGDRSKQAATVQKTTTDGITEVRRMSYTGGMYSGSIVKTYDGRKLEETIINHVGRISERTFYKYDKQSYLTEKITFDGSDKQLNKITYTYDERGSKTTETHFGEDRKMYEWKKSFSYAFDDRLLPAKEVTSISYPQTHAAPQPTVTRLFLKRDQMNNILEEMTIQETIQNEDWKNPPAADTVIVMRNIKYHQP